MVVKNESFMNNTVYGDPEVIGCVDGDSFFISAFPYGFHRMGRHFMFSIVSKFLNSLILDEKTKDTLLTPRGCVPNIRPVGRADGHEVHPYSSPGLLALYDFLFLFSSLAPSKLRYYKMTEQITIPYFFVKNLRHSPKKPIFAWWNAILCENKKQWGHTYFINTM